MTAKPLPSAGLSPAELLSRYERDRLGFLRSMVDRHGPVLQLAAGTVLIAEPSAAQEVFRTTNSAFLMSRDRMQQEVGARRGDEGLEEWMRGRRAIQAAMTPSALTEHSAWLAAETDRLAESWLGRGVIHGAVADLETLMARSFARFCFGTRPAAGVVEGIRDLLQALFPIVSSPLRAPAPLRRVLPRYVRARRADARLRDALTGAVNAPGSGGIAEALLGGQLPLATVVRMLVATGIAAYGVPASTLAWALTELARNADVADTAAAESMMQRWVLAETLRLWPATWLVYRSTEREVTCAGWVIPGQSAVMVCPYLIHRTAACFDRPDEFIPSRWADLTPPAGAYLPFGSGPRRCVGSRLAVAELETALRVLACRLRASLPAGPPTPDVRRTLTAAGLVLEVKPR